MEQSPSWEDDSRSAGQDIPHLLLNTKVYFIVHKGSTLEAILIQTNPVHTFISYLPKINFNRPIILPSTPRSLKFSPPFRFSGQILYSFPSPVRVTWLAHLIVLHLFTLIISVSGIHHEAPLCAVFFILPLSCTLKYFPHVLSQNTLLHFARVIKTCMLTAFWPFISQYLH